MVSKYKNQNQLIRHCPPLPRTKNTSSKSSALSFTSYAQSVDNTMLVALSSIATEQANPMEDMLARTKQLLDYAATHPDAKLHYLASDMQL
jgi:hypothetical protein